jgi:ferredoxin
MPKKIQVIHYPQNCIGCNSCCLAAPKQWRINDETGLAELIGGVRKGDCDILEIEEKDLAANINAAKACPVQIIKVQKT